MWNILYKKKHFFFFRTKIVRKVAIHMKLNIGNEKDERFKGFRLGNWQESSAPGS